MVARPTLDELQRAVRTEICRGCSWRKQGRQAFDSAVPQPCEARCELFQNLPRLRKAAVLLDPMLRSYDQVLNHEIDRILLGRGDRVCSPLDRHRMPLVRVITSLVEA